MTVSKLQLTREQETLLITLNAKAGESALPGSLLHDRAAAEAVAKIAYDFAKLKVDRNLMIGMAIRAHQLDEWVRAYLQAHPDATVLHLGCGLDTRVFRVDPPATARWFDVDYPAVVDLRRQLYTERPGYQLIGSSVTDLAWLDQVPAGGPVMVVAEGLTMYLEPAAGKRLFAAIASRFDQGELAFDAFSRLGVKLVQRHKSVRATGATLTWGIDDPHELERDVHGLHLIAEVPAYAPRYLDRFSWLSGLAIRAFNAVTTFNRIGRFLRYRFG